MKTAIGQMEVSFQRKSIPGTAIVSLSLSMPIFQVAGLPVPPTSVVSGAELRLKNGHLRRGA